MHDLIERMFAASFAQRRGEPRTDSAILPRLSGDRLAFTTDSYVVRPLFFPGGDIGRIAIFGTCNDLAVCGAEPLHLAVAMLLEEGLSMATLWQVCTSIAAAAAAANVAIVTGDTKVVGRGKGDDIYLTTSGIGWLHAGLWPDASRVGPGDAILVSGDIGRHGIAVLAAREEFGLQADVTSDLAPLWPVVAALHAGGVDLHWMRDATRGGLATVLVELAEAAGLSVQIDEDAVPITAPVTAACELFGFDPLYLANEGCMAAVIPAMHVEAALDILRAVPAHVAAARIGTVTPRRSGRRAHCHRRPAGAQNAERRTTAPDLLMPTCDAAHRLCYNWLGLPARVQPGTDRSKR